MKDKAGSKERILLFMQVNWCPGDEGKKD